MTSRDSADTVSGGGGGVVGVTLRGGSSIDAINEVLLSLRFTRRTRRPLRLVVGVFLRVMTFVLRRLCLWTVEPYET